MSVYSVEIVCLEEEGGTRFEDSCWNSHSFAPLPKFNAKETADICMYLFCL